MQPPGRRLGRAVAALILGVTFACWRTAAPASSLGLERADAADTFLSGPGQGAPGNAPTNELGTGSSFWVDTTPTLRAATLTAGPQAARDAGEVGGQRPSLATSPQVGGLDALDVEHPRVAQEAEALPTAVLGLATIPIREQPGRRLSHFGQIGPPRPPPRPPPRWTRGGRGVGCAGGGAAGAVEDNGRHTCTAHRRRRLSCGCLWAWRHTRRWGRRP